MPAAPEAAEDRALQPAVRLEARHDGFDVAMVERRRVANEEPLTANHSSGTPPPLIRLANRVLEHTDRFAVQKASAFSTLWW
jgi:hypothetical protein